MDGEEFLARCEHKFEYKVTDEFGQVRQRFRCKKSEEVVAEDDPGSVRRREHCIVGWASQAC